MLNFVFAHGDPVVHASGETTAPWPALLAVSLVVLGTLSLIYFYLEAEHKAELRTKNESKGVK